MRTAKDRNWRKGGKYQGNEMQFKSSLRLRRERRLEEITTTFGNLGLRLSDETVATLSTKIVF